jgi:CheY-like chemotaxis protein
LSGPFILELETDPNNALKRIQTTSEFNQQNLLEYLNDIDLDEEFDCPLNMTVSKIADIAHEANRSRTITVLVVDQSMPNMTGLELCQCLKNSSIKKIMLTGEASSALAIEAFNKGLIDHFISKAENSSLIPHLESAIHHLQCKYFQERSALILAACKAQPTSFLKSHLFLDHFNLFLKDKEIVEFYLLDTMGSFLGKDAAGKTHHFLVKSEKQMADLLDIAESAEGDDPLIQSLEEMTAMIYFFRPEERDLEVSAWKKMMRPITKKVDGFYLSID